MISCYRLGDLVMLELDNQTKNEILIKFPNSFGSKYILEKRKNNKLNNIDLITKIVLNHMPHFLMYLPKNITESTLIHLRLGDVVGGNEYHEKQKDHLM